MPTIRAARSAALAVCLSILLSLGLAVPAHADHTVNGYGNVEYPEHFTLWVWIRTSGGTQDPL